MADQLLVQVVAKYTRGDGSPEAGSVSFRPLVHASASTGMQTISPVSTDLTETGDISILVRDSFDPSWLMSKPIPYKVWEHLSGSQRSYCVYIKGPGPVDLALLDKYSPLDLNLPRPLSAAQRARMEQR